MARLRSPLFFRRAVRPLRRPARVAGRYVAKHKWAIARRAALGAAVAATGASAGYLGKDFVQYGPRAFYYAGRMARLARSTGGRALLYRNARRLLRNGVSSRAARFLPYTMARWQRTIPMAPRYVRMGTRRGISGAYRMRQYRRYASRVGYLKKAF